MPFSLIPQGFYPSALSLDPKQLRARGITLVLADLDNTLAAYQITQPPPQLTAWKTALVQEGISLFILSNSRRPNRVQQFAQALGVPYRSRAGKPRRAGFQEALARMKALPQQTVMVGDQIFTDVLGANRSGITPLLVRPIQLSGHLGHCLRYALETPFRMLGSRRTFL